MAPPGGDIFGPFMAVFFLVMGVLGAMHIADSPRILLAFDPIYGLRFLFDHALSVLWCWAPSSFSPSPAPERLYADMGHFGRIPIQSAWLFFVLPALTLNYLGQGALVLANPAAVENPFFLLAPQWAAVAACNHFDIATVIASQAVITGAFSLARQAIQLGFCRACSFCTRRRRRKARSTFRASIACFSSASCCSCLCSRIRALSPRPMALR